MDISLNQLLDLDFWYRLVKVGSLYVIPISLSSFRIHAGQDTNKNKLTGTAYWETIQFHEQLFQSLELKNIKPSIKAKQLLQTFYFQYFKSKNVQNRIGRIKSIFGLIRKGIILVIWTNFLNILRSFASSVIWGILKIALPKNILVKVKRLKSQRDK